MQCVCLSIQKESSDFHPYTHFNYLQTFSCINLSQSIMGTTRRTGSDGHGLHGCACSEQTQVVSVIMALGSITVICGAKPRWILKD